MTTSIAHPTPFGIATIASDLDAAREFYTKLYPYEVTENSFGGIRFFSIMKNGETLVSVFERVPGNPMTGTIPVLKVASVGESLRRFQALGATLLIPESVCPCTQTNFALCADKEGNQFIVKEPSVGRG